jgi:hypothetical protein
MSDNDDTAIRLCIRVTNAIITPSSVAIRLCSRCQESVFIDQAQEIPAAVIEVCMQCAMEDPVIGPQLIPGLIQSMAHYAETGVPGIVQILEPGDEGYPGLESSKEEEER